MEKSDDETLLEPEGIDVFINVYDLLAENDYGLCAPSSGDSCLPLVYSLGLGVYHTGVVLLNKGSYSAHL